MKTLVEYDPSWEGRPFSDKSNSMIFDSWVSLRSRRRGPTDLLGVVDGEGQVGSAASGRRVESGERHSRRLDGDLP